MNFKQISYHFSKYKKYIFLYFFLTSFLIFLFFPYSHLGELLKSKIYESSNSTFLVDFKKIKPNIWPLGIAFENFYISHPSFKQITLGDFSLAPIWSQMLFFRTALGINFKNFYGSKTQITFISKTASIQKNKTVHEISLRSEKFDLAQALKDRVLFSELKCVISLNGVINQSPQPVAFEPYGNLTLKSQTPCLLKKLQLTTPIGPLILSTINLSSIFLKANWDNGSYHIETKMGEPKDEIYIKAKGILEASFVEQPQRSSSSLKTRSTLLKKRPWSSDIDIYVSPKAAEKFRIYLMFLNSYKSKTLTGDKYSFTLFSENLGRPPKLKAQ